MHRAPSVTWARRESAYDPRAVYVWRCLACAEQAYADRAPGPPRGCPRGHGRMWLEQEPALP